MLLSSNCFTSIFQEKTKEKEINEDKIFIQTSSRLLTLAQYKNDYGSRKYEQLQPYLKLIGPHLAELIVVKSYD